MGPIFRPPKTFSDIELSIVSLEAEFKSRSLLFGIKNVMFTVLVIIILIAFLLLPAKLAPIRICSENKLIVEVDTKSMLATACKPGAKQSGKPLSFNFYSSSTKPIIIQMLINGKEDH